MQLCTRKFSMILLILISLSVFVQAQDNPYRCTSNGNYTNNSTYSANLIALLNSLSSNMSDYGFYSSSTGQNPDRANALALCRANRTPDQCRTCVQSAVREVLQSCPNQRQAIIWLEYCMVRYSNNLMDKTQTSDPIILIPKTINDSSENNYFREDMIRLMADLRVQAANGSFALKVGVGTRNTSEPQSPMIYGLQQCTPDLSSQDCRSCLAQIMDTMSEAAVLPAGVRMLTPNCNCRCDLSIFYNQTRLRELRLLPPLPPSPTGRIDGNTGGKKDNITTKVVILILVSTGVCLILIACAVIFWRKRMKRRTLLEFTDSADEISSVESLHYEFGKIRAATNDFDDANKLGQGGFGAVYRGKLQSGQEIAVKRLSKYSSQGDTEFKNEVLLVARLQHRNLARLLGFSLEGRERLLIYEFVHNVSLDKFIFDPIKREHLNWDTRYKIIGGVARGLMYLHEDSRLRIIHRDVKASNVLLDGDMNPKIADFGMARLFKQDETQGNTSKIVGTYGYMSPEYAMHGQYSIKSDVFSFGVLILEIISGQRNNCILRGENVEDLLTLTWKNWRDGTTEDMIDPLVKNGMGSVREVLRCVHIGLLCVQENASNRPTMTSVVLMLNSSSISFPVPSEPAFYTAGHKDSIFQEHDSNISSQNSISITELYPR